MNHRDLREYYEFLAFCKSQGKTTGNGFKAITLAIRQHHRQEDCRIRDNAHINTIYDSDGEGCTVIYRFSECTEQELLDYGESLRMTINSPYDCTGQSFTISIDAYALKNGDGVLVHRIGLDV